jgi:hypothetical protein
VGEVWLQTRGFERQARLDALRMTQHTNRDVRGREEAEARHFAGSKALIAERTDVLLGYGGAVSLERWKRFAARHKGDCTPAGASAGVLPLPNRKNGVWTFLWSRFRL